MYFRTVVVVMAVALGLVLSGCGKQNKKGEEIARADFVEFLASSEKDGAAAKNAFDGDASTRWESEWKTDPSWIAIGLKKKSSIEALNIIWEAASGAVYSIEVSDDGKKWKSVKKIEDGQSGEKRLVTLDKPVTAKYLRILGEKRTLDEYGYSIFEIELNPVVLKGEEKVKIVKALSSSVQDSNENELAADFAVDGKKETRWSSAFEDPQWLSVELDGQTSVRAVKIKWEAASAKVYKIQVSGDGNTWKDVADISDGKSDEERMITFKPVKAKYIRVHGEQRNGEWGYSIWELEVYK